MNIIQKLGLATIASAAMLSGCKEPTETEPKTRDQPIVAEEETRTYHVPDNKTPAEQDIPGKDKPVAEKPKEPPKEKPKEPALEPGMALYNKAATIMFQDESVYALSIGYLNALSTKAKADKKQCTIETPEERVYILGQIAGADNQIQESELESKISSIEVKADYTSKPAVIMGKPIYAAVVKIKMTSEQEKSIKQIEEEYKPTNAEMVYLLKAASKNDTLENDGIDRIKAYFKEARK